jgi:predicted transcriptional regulator
LNVLWRLGPAELGAVRGALSGAKPAAATTVATMLGVMREKGLVAREDGPRGYLWSAAVSQEATRTTLLGRLVDAAFDGSASRLVAHLVASGELSDADRESIRKLLDARRPKRGT